MRRESLLIVAYVLAVTVTTAISGALGPLASVIDSVGIGLVIVVRNELHDCWGKDAWRWLPVLILMGTAGSLAANAAHPRVALASGVAFLMANVAASLLWTRSRTLAVIAFAVVDSFVFPPVAFGAFVWWVVGGQIAAKIAGAAAWTLVLRSCTRARRVSGVGDEKIL